MHIIILYKDESYPIQMLELATILQLGCRDLISSLKIQHGHL